MANGTGRAHWGSRLGFVLAAAGSAVGLGNIWKFPYITGEYGGGAFVLFYLLCILVVGLPLMYAELIIGRRGGKDPLGALRALTAHAGPGAKALSVFTGILSVAGGFLILSFYSVVAGWAIHFLLVSFGVFPLGEGGAGAAFGALVGDPKLSSLWHTVFMLLSIVVVARGVHDGIERACSILMPALVGILVLLLVYVGMRGGLAEAVTFLFRPNFHALKPEGMLEALGHAFFTLSLGMGAMITYGSYLSRDSTVVRDGVAVAVLDTVIALLAGLVIFSVVFAAGKEPGQGPGLVFVTLPDLFASMPGGTFVGAAFFFLLIFAAWSSAISLLEVVVTFSIDEFGLTRHKAAWVFGAVIWGLGLASAFRGSVLDFLDNLTTRYMLPIGGIAIAIAAGWLVKKEDREAGFRDLGASGPLFAAIWTVIIRFVSPVAVGLVVLQKIGVLKFGG
ncbi:MAG: sodium-dependent transporter [Gemmatimonadetes bacterium]|nr:sodium-dependent transporter [Gemmatimonadota bacterium]